MILQKLASAIRRQDWFQVVIEVLIVIIGIFLGLQVQNWYEDQADRKLEQEYLVKLHRDTDQLIAIAEVFTNSTARVNLHMGEFTQMLLDGHDGSNVNHRHCNSLAYGHIFVTRIVSLPTLDELISSGQILLIQNEEIRRLFSEFNLRTERTIMLLNSLQADKLEIAREYPELFRLRSVLSGNQANFEELNAWCDYQGMRDNHAFINVVVGNSARYNAYVTDIQDQLEVLHKLRDALTNELDLTQVENGT